MNIHLQGSSRRTRHDPTAMAVAQVGLLFSRCKLWIRRELEIRRAADILSTMDDHLLEDIRLDRGEVKRAVRNGRASSGPQGGRGHCRER